MIAIPIVGRLRSDFFSPTANEVLDRAWRIGVLQLKARSFDTVT